MNMLKLPDPPPCQLIIFPLSAQIGRIRHVAGKYLDQPTANAQGRYWDTISKNLRKHLEKFGCSETAIAEHHADFKAGVQKEIDRLKGWDKPSDRPTDPKGAA